MTGCMTCGGFGMRHDPVAHDWPRESHPAPEPTDAEQARIDEFGIFAEEEGAVSAAKQKGTRFETAVADYLRRQGWEHVERRALNGSTDRGDITGIPAVCIEVKNQERHSLAEWLDEATKEGRNANADVAAVWFKRRGTSSAGSSYVLMDGATFTGLLREAGY